MAQHIFICDACGCHIADSNTMIVHTCGICGKEMRWDLRGIGVSEGDYCHVSDSLAISPDQIAEHKQHFPDVGVLADGRVEFNSVKQHDQYLEKTGFVKREQRIRRK